MIDCWKYFQKIRGGTLVILTTFLRLLLTCLSSNPGQDVSILFYPQRFHIPFFAPSSNSAAPLTGIFRWRSDQQHHRSLPFPHPHLAFLFSSVTASFRSRAPPQLLLFVSRISSSAFLPHSRRPRAPPQPLP